MEGWGDVHGDETENIESLELELSAEGLSYPGCHLCSSSAATMTTPSTGGVNLSNRDAFSSQLGSQMDWVSYYLSTMKSSQKGCFEEEARSFSQEPLHSDMLMCSHGPCQTVAKSSVKEDATQASFYGKPHTSSIHSNKTHDDVNESAKMPVASKIHTKRPAVLGSSSSNDHRKPETMKPRANSSFTSKRSAHCSRSKSRTGKSNSVLNQTSKAEQYKGDKNKKSLQQNTECISPQFYSRFNIYSASNLANDSSRESGVRNESDFQKLSSNVSVSHLANTKPRRPMSMSQRLSRNNGDAKIELRETGKFVDSNCPSCEHKHPYPLHDFSGNETVPRASSLPDPKFPVVANPETVFDSENINGSKDHSSDDHHGPSDASDSGVCNSTDCTSAQGKTIQRQDTHNPDHQCTIRQHPSSDSQHKSDQCTPPICTQSGSPCVSEWSNYSCSKESFSLQNDFVSPPSIHMSPGEDYKLNIESQVMGKMNDPQHRVYIEADGLVKDHTDAVTGLLHSQLHAVPSVATSANLFMGANHTSDMSDILEHFPSFSSQLFEEKPASTMCGSSAAGDIRYFYNLLEKERFRRKHCEKHILKQDAKLLEVQQQLAVAVSTAKRKDVMVEQLDKQLAKFVEGWKKKEAEKDEHIRALKQEKQKTAEALQSQQTVIRSLEQQLSQYVAELSKEKTSSAQAIEGFNNEICQAQRDLNLAEQTLKQEQQKYVTVSEQLNHLKELRQLAENRAQEAEDQLLKEQDRALKKEQELLEKISLLTEADQKMVDLQLLNLEEENKKHKEIVIQNEQLKIEFQKSVLAVDQLIKEKEAEKAEAVDIEMKFQNAQQKLEKDVCAQMEKKIADQASGFYSRMEKSLEEAAACHAKQVEELNAKHQQDLEQQAHLVKAELVIVERRYQQQLNELEERLQVLTRENTLLKESEVKLESQRLEVLNKLQAMMQFQWSEAVSLLVDTPQEKRSASPLLSHENSHQLALDKMPPVTSVSRDLLQTQPVRSQANDETSPQSILSCRYAPSASPAALEVRDNLHTTPGVEDSLKKCEVYRTWSVKGHEPQLSESGQAGRHCSPASVALGSSSPQSFCHKPLNCHNQSDLNSGMGYLTSCEQMSNIPASEGNHQEPLRYRYHTLSMKSPQKPTLQCRSESSHNLAKSGSDLPPVSRNSHIVNKNNSGKDLAIPHQLTGGKPNDCLCRSQPQPGLCQFSSKISYWRQ